MGEDNKAGAGALPLKVKCPGCGKMAYYAGNPNRPFCSERCQVEDRAGWAEEKYAIASEDTPSADWPEGDGGER